jgi:hypothetical protein
MHKLEVMNFTFISFGTFTIHKKFIASQMKLKSTIGTEKVTHTYTHAAKLYTYVILIMKFEGGEGW